MIDRLRNAPVAWTGPTNSASQRGAQTPFSALIADASLASSGSAAPADQSEDTAANSALPTPPSVPPPIAPSRHGAHPWEGVAEPVPAKADRSIRSVVEELNVEPARDAVGELSQPPVAVPGKVASEVSISAPSFLEQRQYQVPGQSIVETDDGDEKPLAAIALVSTEARAAEASPLTPTSSPQRLQNSMDLDGAPSMERATHAPMLPAGPPARDDQWSKEAVGSFQITARAMLGSQVQSGVVSLEIKEPGRPVETVNVPWKLLAHMTLSQQGRRQTPVSTSNERPTLGVECISHSAIAGKNTSTQVISDALPALRSEDHALLGAVSVSVKSAQNDTPIGTNATEHSAFYMNAAATPWAQRLVRWASDQASDTSLWLRDYTIDEEAAADLLRSLQAFAKENGVHVTRMMFNGQELWRAPTLVSQGE
jgi:hypothetical protein